VKHKISDFVLASDNEPECVTVRIRDHMEWIVTMWHFGADSIAEYSDEKNYRRWGIAERILITIYVKEWKSQIRDVCYKNY
jgi:hypothetical protein